MSKFQRRYQNSFDVEKHAECGIALHRNAAFRGVISQLVPVVFLTTTCEHLQNVCAEFLSLTMKVVIHHGISWETFEGL